MIILAPRGTPCDFEAEGDDAEQAIQTLVELVAELNLVEGE